MAGLNVFIQRLERMATSEVKEAIAKQAQMACHNACLDCFKEQRDPYGVPWAKRVEPTGLWKLLDKTGAGIDSITSSSRADGVRVSILSRMKFHQTGTYRMVARKYFPDPARGLGSYEQPVHEATAKAITDLMYGRST